MDQPFFSPAADALIESLPKVNLHTHLEGSLRPQTLCDLAEAQGKSLPAGRETIADVMQVNGSERTLVDYLAKISIVNAVLNDREALRRAAFEAAEDAANGGVVYYELRAGPALHTCPGLTVDEVIEALLLGLHQAEVKYGMICRLIVAGLRNHPPQVNLDLAQAAIAWRGKGVVGYDLAGDEAGYPAELHASAYRTALEGGLGITVHAGEASGAENVRYAVESLGAKRIGHGVRSIESRAVMDLLRERGVLLEICPTSNVHTHTVPGIAAHPVRQLFDHGVRISINDDDPTTSRTRVSNELTLLKQTFGFSLQELCTLQVMAMEAAFLEDQRLKSTLRLRILRAWQNAARHG